MPMAMMTRWKVVALALAVLACGPEAGSGDDGSESSTASSGDDDGTTSSTATSSSTSTTASDDSGSTGGDVCAQFVSTPDIGPEVILRVRHDGEQPVWVRPIGCGGAAPFELLGLAGQPLRWRFGECFPERCEEFLGATDCLLGCPDCAPPWIARLDPAAMADSTWSGVSMTPLQMTAECAPGNECQRECLREDQAPGGEYTLQLTVYRGCTGACECDIPEAQGLCPIWEQAELSDPTTLAVPFSYPDTPVVEVVVP